MSTKEMASSLSEIDALETWGQHFPEVDNNRKKEIYKIAQALWIKRMVKTEKLLVNPIVSKQLEEQHWQATDIQKRMIWASVLASADGKDSKERFKTIKTKLLKKYGRDWWEDVYKRKTNAWAAKERIRKQTESHGPGVKTMINNTILFSGIAAQERNAALKMIPTT